MVSFTKLFVDDSSSPLVTLKSSVAILFVEQDVSQGQVSSPDSTLPIT